MSLGYNFGLGTNDNGNVYGITNNKTSSRSQSFLYDGVNRLTSAKSGAWGCHLHHRSVGNYTGTNAVTALQLRPDLRLRRRSEQLTAYAGGYDAEGNLLSDGLNTYAFDAESRIKTGAGVTYTYDGDGERISKSSGTLYWGDLAESDLAGNLTSEYVFDGDKRIARRDVATGNVYYYFSDYLDSSNVVTNAAGIIQNESDFYPFGGENRISNLLTNSEVQIYRQGTRFRIRLGLLRRSLYE